MTLDELNARVTAAIMKAELAQRQAADAWADVAATELAISQHPDTPESERDIAQRGHARASYISVTIRMCPSHLPREIETEKKVAG